METARWTEPWFEKLKALNNPADKALIDYGNGLLAQAGNMAPPPTSVPPASNPPTSGGVGSSGVKRDPRAGPVLPSGYVNPCPAGRISPYSGDDGCDIHAPVGTPVFAVKGGVVVYNDPSGHSAWEGPGNHTGAVRIRHDDGTYGWYAHLSSRNLDLKPGMRIPAGALIGGVGTANSVPHLHISIFYSPGGDSGGFMAPFTLADKFRG